MSKINYLSKQEQSVWELIKNKKIIDNELIRLIFPDFSKQTINQLLHKLHKKRSLSKARRELYFIPRNIDNFYELALKINKGYIGLSSALKIYGLTEYEDFTIFIITRDKYEKVDKVRRINANQSAEKVFEDVKGVLSEWIKK